LILHEIGLGESVEALALRYIRPLARVLYPEWGGGDLDHVHAFQVEYDAGGDTSLSKHMDSSEVTLNLCLQTENLAGSTVFFEGVRRFGQGWGEPSRVEVVQKPGVALLHLGQNMHGASELAQGKRSNVIIWMKSRKSRQSSLERFLFACPKAAAQLENALSESRFDDDASEL